MIKALPSIVIGLLVILEIACPLFCQYILNIGMAGFSINYILKTINRFNKKEWRNDHITKRERSRVLYIATCLLTGYIVINIAWFIQVYIHPSDEYVIVSSLLDKIYSLYELLGLIFAVYVTFQVNMELNDDDDNTGDEGFVTKLMKGRYYKQAGKTNEPKNN